SGSLVSRIPGAVQKSEVMQRILAFYQGNFQDVAQ
ncbi:TPA: DUF977 family protein, partial [Escherichia coli]|nr:DUF977 family protein [Escherichia coli]